MKLPRICLLIISLSITTAVTALISSYAKPGCEDKCSNLTIPYPFGIGPNCFLRKWYVIECKSSKPYLSALQNMPLLAVDLNEQTVVVSIPITAVCQAPILNSSQILNLGHDSPFLFSKIHNKFIVEGCGTATISCRGSILTGCNTMCSQPYVRLRRNKCDPGNNCCQEEVPYYLVDYGVNVTTTTNESCLSAFVVADNSYVECLVPGQTYVGDSSSIPTVIRWRLRENDFSKANCEYNFSQLQLEMDVHTVVTSGKCSCQNEFHEGNPYLSGGCKGLGISMLVLLITALGIAMYKVIQRANDKRQKKMFFERNGGLLLKQQEARNENLAGKTKLFTSKELEKATHYFNETMIIGRGGQGTVYKGNLHDGRIVAVKKSKEIDQVS